MSIERVAVLGGTGPLGCGLARRLALAGYEVVIGSREQGEAERVAASLRTTSGQPISGAENADAADGAAICILSIPADGIAELLAALRPRLVGKLIIDVVVPLALRDGVVEHAPPAGERSAGGLVQRLLPESAVVSAFKTIPAATLDGPAPPHGTASWGSSGASRPCAPSTPDRSGPCATSRASRPSWST